MTNLARWTSVRQQGSRDDGGWEESGWEEGGWVEGVVAGRSLWEVMAYMRACILYWHMHMCILMECSQQEAMRETPV